MSPKVTLYTCTGHRPEALAICQKLITQQTRQPDQWIIVQDDGAAMHNEFRGPHIDHLWRSGPPYYADGVNTQRFNMLAGLENITGDLIIIIEDDDYYAPNYIEEMVKLLERAPVVGLSNSRYYHVGIPGHLTRKNYEHSSLCHTGFRREHLPLMEAAVQTGELFFDIAFWKQVKALEIPFILSANSSISVGMKGMPGRPGIGAGHRTKGFLYDAGHVKLKEWVGSDYHMYLPYLKGPPSNQKAI